MTLRRIGLALLTAASLGATAQADNHLEYAHTRFVLLISVDGLHALDVANYIDGHPNSAFAQLAQRGVTFSNARTPANSD